MSSIDETPTVRGGDSVPGDTDGAGGLESRVLLARARARLLGSDAEPVNIGRYRILERIGAGGMGVVYLAVDDARSGSRDHDDARRSTFPSIVDLSDRLDD